MQKEGLISMRIGGQPASPWKLAAWQRSPSDSSTASDLEKAELEITDLGIKYVNGP